MRTVVVTGANSGIGLATVLLLADGWQVIGAGVGDAPPIHHVNFQFVSGDLTDDASLNTLMQTIEAHGTLDALVNCAGVNLPGVLETLPITMVQRQFAVNVEVPLRLIQRCLPYLRSTGGRIVNISSVMGEVAMPTMGAYSMSKHALEAMSDVLRLELAGQGVSVSVVQMGAVKTPMTSRMTESLDNARGEPGSAAHSLYQRLYDRMRAALTQQDANAIGVDTVAAVIQQALESKRPQPRYRVDAASKGLSLMRRLSPQAIGDKILRRALGIV